jgi:hypothetical protein
MVVVYRKLDTHDVRFDTQKGTPHCLRDSWSSARWSSEALHHIVPINMPRQRCVHKNGQSQSMHLQYSFAMDIIPPPYQVKPNQTKPSPHAMLCNAMHPQNPTLTANQSL